MNSAFTSLALKLIGVIFILSSLLDYIVLAIPSPNQVWGGGPWLIGFVASIVDRGIVPMVGIACLLVGYWISYNSEIPVQKSRLDLRLPVFILSALLGLMFLLFIPVYVSNLNQQKNTALEQIKQGATQGTEQIQAFLGQINTLSRNPQLLDQQIAQLNQVIETGQLQGRQLTAQQLENARQQRDQIQGLRDLSKDPKKLKERVTQIKNQLETQLRDRQVQAENQANTEALKNSLRISLSSLMLTIGYFVIGGFGLAGLKSSKSSGNR
jgi:hypothetical protein